MQQLLEHLRHVIMLMMLGSELGCNLRYMLLKILFYLIFIKTGEDSKFFFL